MNAISKYVLKEKGEKLAGRSEYSQLERRSPDLKKYPQF